MRDCVPIALKCSPGVRASWAMLEQCLSNAWQTVGPNDSAENVQWSTSDKRWGRALRFALLANSEEMFSQRTSLRLAIADLLKEHRDEQIFRFHNVQHIHWILVFSEYWTSFRLSRWTSSSRLIAAHPPSNFETLLSLLSDLKFCFLILF